MIMVHHRTLIRGAGLCAPLLLAACSNTVQPDTQLGTLAVTFPAEGVTAPGGIVRLGADFWVSDHLLGFCRLESGADPDFDIDQDSCKTDAASPGQPSFGGGFVFVPDNSSKGTSVWRYAFDTTNTLGAGTEIPLDPVAEPTRLAATAIIGGDVYVGSIKSGAIRRIVGGVSGGTTVDTVGQTSSGGGIAGLAAVGTDLYIAEETGVTKLTNAAGTAVPTASGAAAPLSIAANGTDLFIGDGNVILRFNTANNMETEWATDFAFPTAIYADATSPAILVGDDPTEDEQGFAGYVDEIAFGETGRGGGLGQPLTTGAKFADRLTAPGGLIRLGPDWWVSDHVLGFCRLDLNATAGLLRVNQSTCKTDAASPGQASFLQTNSPTSGSGLVFVPDNSSKGQGIWRFPYTRGTRSLGTGRLIRLATATNLPRPTATALSPSGTFLYVSYLKSNNLTRITNLTATSPTFVRAWGRTGDTKGASSLAIARDLDGNNTLYLAASTGVKTVQLACSPSPSGCIADATTISAAAPLALASNGNKTVFVADGAAGNLVLTYDVDTDTTQVLASEGTNDRAFKFISALAFRNIQGVGHVYAADDPTEGDQVLRGAAWDITIP
jgi:hypothetical protein